MFKKGSIPNIDDTNPVRFASPLAKGRAGMRNAPMSPMNEIRELIRLVAKGSSFGQGISDTRRVHPRHYVAKAS